MQKLPKINLNRVKSLFKEMNNEKGILGVQLVEEIMFMKTTLTKLKSEIKEKGVVTTMQQGDYSIERANPAIAQYNSLIKNYNVAIKHASDMLPAGQTIEDEFDDFNK